MDYEPLTTYLKRTGNATSIGVLYYRIKHSRRAPLFFFLVVIQSFVTIVHILTHIHFAVFTKTLTARGIHFATCVSHFGTGRRCYVYYNYTGYTRYSLWVTLHAYAHAHLLNIGRQLRLYRNRESLNHTFLTCPLLVIMSRHGAPTERERPKGRSKGSNTSHP